MKAVVVENTLAADERWKHYPEYKDSGVEWLGEIPAGWGVQAAVTYRKF